MAAPAFEPGTAGAWVIRALSALNARAFKLSGGRIGGTYGGLPVLLLDHVGRKSGTPRTSPVAYLEDGDDLVIVASRAGSDAMPAWWLNLKAAPRTEVQVGRERRTVVARQANEQERAALWPKIIARSPDFEVYEQRTERVFPVIILSPA